MKYLPFLSSLLISIPLISIKPANAQSNVSFRCDLSSKTPRTVAITSKKEINLIVWESKAFQASGFTPERRCNEVSDRLQMHAKSGKLRYITTGMINNQKVICVADYIYSKCRPNGLILTLKSDENPKEVLKSLLDTAFKVSGGKPAIREGERMVYDLNQVFNELEPEPIK
jgi:hypothetical protein